MKYGILRLVVGCVVQRWNVGVSPANFLRPTLDLQLTGDVRKPGI